MPRMLIAFAIVYALFHFGIPAFRALSGKEKWDLTKTISYSILCAVLAVVALTLMVIVF
jgi:hypothetical protein